MLQPRALVLDVQYLIGRPADCYDGRADDLIVMLDTTCRVRANESDQIFQCVTNK